MTKLCIVSRMNTFKQIWGVYGFLSEAGVPKKKSHLQL
jgi:hypothetical protein